MATQMYGGVNNKELRRRREWSEIPLPDELVLSSILSHLTMKEVARTSLVSRNWLRYWRHLSVLNFDNPTAMERMASPQVVFPKSVYCKKIKEERRDFINRVDNILAKHMGTTIHQFKVTFYLQNSHQNEIDRWVVWALSKHVQRLQLDFTVPMSSYATLNLQKYHYALDKPILDYCYEAFKVKPLLTSLCLMRVNVSNQFVEQLLESCGSILEKLWIQKSEHLTSIKSNNNAFISLRYLTISYCNNLDTIDIEAPKLQSFTYETICRHEYKSFRIANASSLSYVSIDVPYEDQFFYVLRSLSIYLSQLDDLTLSWYLNSKTNLDPVVDYFPVLAKLKHLKMDVNGYHYRNIAGWVPFIQKCPLLEKLTMKLRLWFSPSPPKNIKWYEHQLVYLKTLEILEFNGINVDVDVAKFVFDNAVTLQEVIFKGPDEINMRGALHYLKLKIPERVKLVTLFIP